MTTSREVTLVAAPGEDDLEETDSLVVQRQWDNQMHYVICVSGRAFPIGSVIPIHVTLFPTAKVKVYRVAAVLEGTLCVIFRLLNLVPISTIFRTSGLLYPI